MPENRPLILLPNSEEWLYDGTLPGLYTLVFDCVYQKTMPAGIHPEHEAQPSLLPQHMVYTDEARAERVRNSIGQGISPDALELVETVFLSCMIQKEMAILRFLQLAYGVGPKVMDMLGHERVAPLIKAQRHLHGEAHLLKGFIRFSDYDGVLGAIITPKNFVLPFLMGHFCARYPNEAFLIYDKNHGAALLHEKGRREIFPLEEQEFNAPSREEVQYRELWRRFYDTIAIESRTNHRCRMGHMPKRYWENMTEFQREDGSVRAISRGMQQGIVQKT
ncbi:TIGR03915 family putative DNA repair protein [Eubacteriales bacterium OttesenSCG-928-M02]|nr:TIGR03915 family putative DNA repair protein [Eubacteriales bacterium OttesenSCG-928-M02]